MFWLAIAFVTAVATAWVTRPLWSTTAAGVGDAGDPAARIYKDQLTEIDADLARGILGEPEAAAARAEIARRLLAHDANRKADRTTVTAELGPIPGYVLMAALPVAALVGYLLVGSPWLPDQPFATRTDGGPSQAAAILAFERLEEQLAENPNDGEGWDRIAPAYLRIGRYDQAVTAFERAIAVNGESLGRLTGLARAHIFQQDGLVNAPALKALEGAVRLQPDNLDNRFWMAVGREQAGDVVAAIDEYRRILPQGDPDAPWRRLAEQRLAAAEARLANAGPRIGAKPQIALAHPAPQAAPGMPQLSAEQIEAAKQMSGGDQKAMVEGMVGRLAERLKTNGTDAEGWQRLVTAYVVLGRKGDAITALSEARKQLAADRDALAKLDALALKLGIGS